MTLGSTAAVQVNRLLGIFVLLAGTGTVSGACSFMKPHITLGELHSTRILHPTPLSHEFTISVTTTDSNVCQWKEEPTLELEAKD